jgi:hypothetical protein
MGLEDVLQPAGLFNLVTLLAVLAVWYARKPASGAARAVLLVVLAGTALHFLTDLTADLGTEGEHLLMHAVALGAVLATLAR